MDIYQFSISKFGVFDSNVAFPKMKETQNRSVLVYELELCTVDCPGSSFINEQKIPLKCGTFICAKPGQIRRSILPYKCLFFHILTCDRALISLLDQIPDSMMLPDMQYVIKLFHEMLAVESSKLPEDRLLLQSCVCRLIYYICQFRHTSHTDYSDGALLHQKRVLAVEKYIRDHISEELPLSILAAQCNLSPTYFHRLFTDFFHKTPAQYILEHRIQKAKQGLLTGDYTLAELAEICGFSSQAYFCYKFRKTTGKTPSEYRKEMMGRVNIL